jgi:glycogen operon protein
LEFTQFVIKLFHQHPVLHRQKFLHGRKIRGSEVKDLTWFRPNGKEMGEEDWNNPWMRSFGLRLAGDAIDEVDQEGNPIIGETLLILLNAHHEPLPFVLPAHKRDLKWELLLDTKTTISKMESVILKAGKPFEMEARSVALFVLRESNT